MNTKNRQFAPDVSRAGLGYARRARRDEGNENRGWFFDSDRRLPDIRPEQSCVGSGRVSGPVTAVENDGKVVTHEGVLQPTQSPQHPPDETIRYCVEGVTALRGSLAEAGFVRYRSNLTAYRTPNEVFTQSMSDVGKTGGSPPQPD